jgi:Xaa-Pro dipeptidase
MRSDSEIGDYGLEDRSDMRDRALMESEIASRIERLKGELDRQGIDGALVVQLADLFYFSNTDQDAHLWVSSSRNPILMVRKSMARAAMDSPIKTQLPLKGFKQMKELVVENLGKTPKKIGLEMDTLPASFLLAYQKLFPDTEMVDISPLILGIRMVKSGYEIGCIRKATKAADEMFEKVPEFMGEGETEMNVAMKIESFLGCHGHPAIVRMRGFNREGTLMFVISGHSASMVSSAPGAVCGTGPGAFYSQGPGDKRIRKNEPVVVDVAVCHDGYLSDQTRIFSIGSVSENLARAHDEMLRVQEMIAQKAVPGVAASALYDLAVEQVERAGLSSGFMGYPEAVPFVGHGVGLELDEWPILGKKQNMILAPGMTIAVEPKFVTPEKGAVGIEDTFLVGPHGMERLNRFPNRICVL